MDLTAPAAVALGRVEGEEIPLLGLTENGQESAWMVAVEAASVPRPRPKVDEDETAAEPDALIEFPLVHGLLSIESNLHHTTDVH